MPWQPMHIATLPSAAFALPTTSADAGVAKPARPDSAAITAHLPPKLFIALLTWLEGKSGAHKAAARAERNTTFSGLFAAAGLVATQAKKIALIVPRDLPPVHTRTAPKPCWQGESAEKQPFCLRQFAPVQ